jgi:hypothetical protein
MLCLRRSFGKEEKNFAAVRRKNQSTNAVIASEANDGAAFTRSLRGTRSVNYGAQLRI